MTDTKDAAPKADASVQSDAPTAAQTADASSSQGDAGFKRTVGVFDMVVYGLIFMVPIATFSLFGGVSNASGGMPALAYFVAFIGMFFSVLSFGMMIGTFPSSGSIYTYTSKSIGKGLGFVAGWLMLLQYLTSPDMVFIMGAEALSTYVPQIPVWGWCLIFLVFVFVVASRGMSTTMFVNRIALILEFIVLGMFIVFGVVYIIGHPETSGFSLTALFNPNTFSVSGVMGAASLAVFSFVGFGCVATLTDEAKDERHGPSRAMMTMVIILVAIFVLTCFIATCVDPSGQICKNDENNGFYHIAELVGGKWFGVVCAVSVALAQGVFTGLVATVSVSRILYVMGKSGSLPGVLAKIDEKRQVPIVATCFVSALSLVLLAPFLLIGMEGLGKVVNFGALSTYFLLNLCVVVWFWFRKKDHGNPVRFLVCPILGMIVVFALLLSLDVPAKIIGVVWIAIGIVYYLVMTRALHREITME